MSFGGCSEDFSPLLLKKEVSLPYKTTNIPKIWQFSTQFMIQDTLKAQAEMIAALKAQLDHKK